MKTLEEFTKELEGSETLRKELGAINDKAEMEAFFKKNGCGFTAKEFFDRFGSDEDVELDDDSAEQAAGGNPCVKAPTPGILQGLIEGGHSLFR